jgi:hypothetical protein
MDSANSGDVTIHRMLPLFAVGLLACLGRIGEGGTEEGGPGAGTTEEFEPAFATQDTQPLLLPFWVRMERVSALVGKSLDDPMFNALKANRLGLGDYDYASGVKPDRMWSPARMTLWAKSLRPVCSSEAMHALYPNLATDPADILALASDAWGREVATEEMTFDAPNLASLSQAERFDTICLAILTSTEFVIQ